jgi:hypothetical protein
MNADEAETGFLGWFGDRRDRPEFLLGPNYLTKTTTRYKT